MRLIDADALPKYTGMALSADEVARAVENAPTIDAIPIEWIKEWVNNYCNRYEERLFECLFRTWSKNGREVKDEID